MNTVVISPLKAGQPNLMPVRVSLPFMAEQRRHNQGDSKSDEIDLGLQTFDKV
jgi:hypothetical protein